nr:MAG TPA: hypothetical protein [Caudoviricetes sp.]
MGFFKFDKQKTSSLEDYCIIRKSFRYSFKRIFSPDIMEFCESLIG